MSADTIFALSSGAGRAAVAVIRISGPATRQVIEAVCGRSLIPRRATVVRLRAPPDAEDLDSAMAIWMPGPASFTGEDCAEVHTHGGRAVVDDVVCVLAAMDGCRVAEPGEFTQRAFLNGKMDLTAVEGLADLIDAETRAQRRQALHQLDGPLGARAEAWRKAVLHASALVEADIDFSDESDVVTNISVVKGLLSPPRAEIAHLLAREGRRGERLRDGFTVVIAGPPNAGKSTLLNALARRDVAIVSPQPGTTRDAIEVHLDVGGLPVVLIDTAGIRDSLDVVELEGITRARRRAERADLVLWLKPACDPRAPDAPAFSAEVLTIETQIDRLPSYPPSTTAISALAGVGLDELLALIEARASGALIGAEPALLTRVRHAEALRQAVAALDRVLDVGSGAPIELVAEDMRLAARHLGRVAGRIDVEDVLGEIFAQFCIGK